MATTAAAAAVAAAECSDLAAAITATGEAMAAAAAAKAAAAADAARAEDERLGREIMEKLESLGAGRYVGLGERVVHLRGALDDSLLHHAVNHRVRSAVEWLLANGADINAADCNGRTPLMWAIKAATKVTCCDGGCCADVMRLLLRKGADANAVDCSGRDALCYAVSFDATSADILELLLAETGVTTEPGRNPLLWMALRDNRASWAFTQRLITAGYPVDAEDEDTGRTPLIVAADRGDYRTVRALVELGVPLEHEDADGRTAALAAAENGCWWCVRGLVRAGADAGAAVDGRGIAHHLLSWHLRQEDVDAVQDLGDAEVRRNLEVLLDNGLSPDVSGQVDDGPDEPLIVSVIKAGLPLTLEALMARNGRAPAGHPMRALVDSLYERDAEIALLREKLARGVRRLVGMIVAPVAAVRRVAKRKRTTPLRYLAPVGRQEL